VCEVRRLAGNWRELCADELRHVPPSWALAVATWISRFGRRDTGRIHRIGRNDSGLPVVPPFR
jgi:hypothetical protein